MRAQFVRLAAALALLCAAAAPQMAAQPLAPTGGGAPLRGKVFIVSRDKYDRGVNPSKEIYFRNDTTSSQRHEMYRLEGAGLGMLRTGMRVTLGGSAMDSTVTHGGKAATVRFTVRSVTVNAQPDYPDRTVIVTGRGAGGGAGRRLAQAALPTVKLSLEATDVSTLVLPISLEGCPNPTGGVYAAPWYSKQDVERVIFEDGGGDGGPASSVGALFRTCSYGQTTLTRSNSVVAPVLRLPCAATSMWGTPFNSQYCDFTDFSGWSEQAMDQAAAAGIDVDRYLYKAVILPPGTACGFVGLGYIGCDFSFPCSSWVQADILMGVQRGATPSHQSLFHEIGHNLFLGHAATLSPTGAVDEYGDVSCAMGYCCTNRCFNTAHAWQLGWVAPQLLNGSSLAAGQARTLSVAALTRGPSSGVKLDVSWVAGQASLYLGYRLAEGADAALESGFVGRVELHSYAGTSNHAPDFSYLLGTLRVGDSLAHAASNTSFRLVSADPGAGVARLWVCRRSATGAETRDTCLTPGFDGDCDGLSGAADPDCTGFITAAAQQTPSATPPPPSAGAQVQPANAAASCKLGHAFCTAVATSARAVKPAASYYVKGTMAGMCQYWLSAMTCAGSRVKCGCANVPAGINGSGVLAPVRRNATTGALIPVKQLRCDMGHATCAAAKPGSYCQFWLAKPTCTGSGTPGIACSCAKALKLPAKRNRLL